jgi:hypothetical protein
MVGRKAAFRRSRRRIRDKRRCEKRGFVSLRRTEGTEMIEKEQKRTIHPGKADLPPTQTTTSSFLLYNNSELLLSVNVHRRLSGLARVFELAVDLGGGSLRRRLRLKERRRLLRGTGARGRRLSRGGDTRGGVGGRGGGGSLRRCLGEEGAERTLLRLSRRALRLDDDAVEDRLATLVSGRRSLLGGRNDRFGGGSDGLLIFVLRRVG